MTAEISLNRTNDFVFNGFHFSKNDQTSIIYACFKKCSINPVKIRSTLGEGIIWQRIATVQLINLALN